MTRIMAFQGPHLYLVCNGAGGMRRRCRRRNKVLVPSHHKLKLVGLECRLPTGSIYRSLRYGIREGLGFSFRLLRPLYLSWSVPVEADNRDTR